MKSKITHECIICRTECDCQEPCFCCGCTDCIGRLHTILMDEPEQTKTKEVTDDRRTEK